MRRLVVCPHRPCRCRLTWLNGCGGASAEDDLSVRCQPRAMSAIPAVPAIRAGTAPVRGKSRWPARLDWLQSASGLVLALFMWGHMLFVSSILLGKDAMWTVTRFFEGYFVFGRSYPWVVSIAVAGIVSLLVMHAMLAVRKFPIDY